MGEPKKKPGRSRKNGTDWELRRYVMLLAAVIVLILSPIALLTDRKSLKS